MSLLYYNKKKLSFIRTLLDQASPINENSNVQEMAAVLKKCEVRLRAVTAFYRPDERPLPVARLVADLATIDQAIKANNNLPQARGLLQGFDGRVNDALEKAKITANRRIKIAALRPKHEYRVNQADRLIKRITAVDEGKGGEFRGRLNLLKTLPPDPDAAQRAYKGLKTLIDELSTKLAGLSARAQGTVGNGNYQQARRDAERVLGELRLVVPIDKIESFENQIANSAKRVALEADQSDAEQEKLVNSTAASNRILEEFRLAKQQCGQRKAACETIIKDIHGVVPASVAQKYQSAWDSIEILLGLREYVQALNKMTTLTQTYGQDQFVKTAAQKKKDWEGVKTGVDENLSKLVKAMSRLGRADPKLAGAALLRRKLQKANELAQAGDFAAALDAMPQDDWQRQIEALPSHADTFERLSLMREAAQKTFQECYKAFETEIVTFEAKGGDGSYYRDELARYELAWEAARDSASTEEDFHKALSAFKQSFEHLRFGLGLEGNHAAILEDSKARRKVAEARVAMNDPLGRLAVYLPDVSEAYRKKVVNAKTLKELEELKTDVEGVLGVQENKLEQLRGESVHDTATYEREIKQLKKVTKAAGPYFDELSARVLAARGMLESPVEDVVKDGKKELDGVKEALDKIKSAYANPKSATTFENVQADSDALRKEITKHDSLAKTTPTVQKDLLNQLTALTRRALALPPAQGRQLLAAFRSGVFEPARKKAEASAKQRTELIAEGKKLKTKVETVIPKFLVKYRAALLARIQAALDTEQGAEAFAENQLALIAVELNACEEDNSNSYKLAQESRAEADALEQDRRKKEWEGRVHVYKKYRMQAGAANGERFSNKQSRELLKTLDTRFSQAERLAKNGFFDEAETALIEAEQMARKLIRTPGGPRASSCDKLPKIEKEYQAAVAAFVSQVAALAKTIDDALNNEPNAPNTIQRAKIKDQLSALSTSFNPKAFETLVTVAVNHNLNVAERRASREAALAGIRSYLDLFKTDPLLSRIEFNPFKTGVNVSHLRAKLVDLNVNLLRCI